MSAKLNLFCIYIFQPGGLESCHFLPKKQFCEGYFRKIGIMCGHVLKNAKAYRNCYAVILKWRNLCEHCMYNENWWNNKTEKEWHLFVCVFIIAVNNVFWNSLHLLVMLILTGFYICYACYPWWASQILLKFGWNEPFCNRNKPWKFQLSIISDLEFICHWILRNFPILGWSWANNKFLPNLSDSYIYSLEFCSA